MKQRGICPVCGVERFVTWAGGMWNHKGDICRAGRRLKCAGVGRPPAPTVHEGGTARDWPGVPGEGEQVQPDEVAAGPISRWLDATTRQAMEAQRLGGVPVDTEEAERG